MFWNYRWVRHVSQTEEPRIELREVYYDTDGTPRGHSTPFLIADDEPGVQQETLRICNAAKQPVLNWLAESNRFDLSAKPAPTVDFPDLRGFAVGNSPADVSGLSDNARIALGMAKKPS